MFKKLLAILLLLSLTTAFCSVSLAEDMMKIGEGGFLNCVNYQDTLPDGRLIFCGSGGDHISLERARLLCVNPDGTVSWEYVDQDEKEYYDAVVLEDGNIAVRTQKKVIIFTREGKNTGKELISDSDDVNDTQVLSRGLLKRSDKYTEFVDWDGNVLFRTEGAFFATITGDDGLVMRGRDPGFGEYIADAMIQKIDWQGNLLWKKILSPITEEQSTFNVSDLDGLFRASDGGYVAVHKQFVHVGDWKNCSEVIKFSADGEILWTKQPGEGQMFEDVVEYEGKYCVSYKSGMDIPANVSYLWLDADGKELGTTRRAISRQDIPGQWNGRLMRKMQMEMIHVKDGLWQNIQFLNEYVTSAGISNIVGVEQMLMRIPVL